MTASLNQSGSRTSASAARGLDWRSLGWSMTGSAAAQPGTDAEDGEWQLLRHEPPVLQLAVPAELHAAHELLHRQRTTIREAEFPQRYLELCFLHVVRIEADEDQEEVIQVRRELAVGNHLFV